jgi:hypothetical protein
VSRAISSVHNQRAARLTQRVRPAEHGLARHERMMLERADYERDLARRWATLSKTLVQGSR